MLKKATKDGTLSANSYELNGSAGFKGISLGKFGEQGYVAVESDGHGIRILVNEDRIREDNATVVHTNRDWVEI